MSVSISPSLSFTVSLPPAPSSTAFTPFFSTRFSPWLRAYWCTSQAMSKSSGAMRWSLSSTMVVSTPLCFRFSAISTPMYPPPMTTALSGNSSST